MLAAYFGFFKHLKFFVSRHFGLLPVSIEDKFIPPFLFNSVSYAIYTTTIASILYIMVHNKKVVETVSAWNHSDLTPHWTLLQALLIVRSFLCIFNQSILIQIT